MAARVVSAAVAIPIVVAVDYLGGPTFAILAGLAAAIGSLELVAMFRQAGFRPFLPIAVLAATVTAMLPLYMRGVQSAWIVVLIAALVLTGAIFLVPRQSANSLVDWILTVAPVLYVGLLIGHLTLLRTVPHGARWVLCVLLMTWAFDTGAYAAGRTVGRRPFMHHISPNKTVEGVAGGLLLSALTGLCTVPALGLAVWQGLAFGLTVGVVAQLGDLIESMVKRQTGVKDSGTIFPGHGGLLDRIDSLLLTGTLGYYVALIVGHAS